MSQSLANINVHLVYSTKQRERLIGDVIRPRLHTYMGGILRKFDCLPAEINTEPDHAHVLFVLGRSVAISKLVSNLKTGATDWLRKQNSALTRFHWQNGYGAFSVSASNMAAVRTYIRNQRHTTAPVLFRTSFARCCVSAQPRAPKPRPRAAPWATIGLGYF